MKMLVEFSDGKTVMAYPRYSLGGIDKTKEILFFFGLNEIYSGFFAGIDNFKYIHIKRTDTTSELVLPFKLLFAWAYKED